MITVGAVVSGRGKILGVMALSRLAVDARKTNTVILIAAYQGWGDRSATRHT